MIISSTFKLNKGESNPKLNYSSVEEELKLLHSSHIQFLMLCKLLLTKEKETPFN